MGLYVILMGVQGAGKGVQAAYIRDQYGIPHVSTGDLFRAMRHREDDLAKRVQQIMSEGKLIDDDTTNEVVRDRLSQPDAKNGVILDGYPRTPPQAEWLENYLRARGEKVNVVLLLELDLYTAFKRAFGRVTHPDGRSFNIYSNDEGIDWRFEDHPDKAYPPTLVATETATGDALTRRPDDGNAHAILKRIDTYVELTQPLIDYFEAKGLVRRIDADQSIEAVSESIKQAIESSKSE